MVGSSDLPFFLGVRQFRNAGERERATGGVMANDAGWFQVCFCYVLLTFRLFDLIFNSTLW